MYIGLCPASVAIASLAASHLHIKSIRTEIIVVWGYFGMSCLLWPREAPSGQKLNGKSRKRSHQSIRPGLQTNASWWSQYQVLSVHFVLLFWLCCMCSLGSFKWKRGTVTVFQHAWHHYIAWPHDYIIHISTWTLCRASRAVSISGIHHHGTTVQNAIWAVQPQLRWSPALHNETGKMKKNRKGRKGIIIFSWIMMYHDVSSLHHLCIMPSWPSPASKRTWPWHAYPQWSLDTFTSELLTSEVHLSRPKLGLSGCRIRCSCSYCKQDILVVPGASWLEATLRKLVSSRFIEVAVFNL